jgi:hypothetical protein
MFKSGETFRPKKPAEQPTKPEAAEKSDAFTQKAIDEIKEEHIQLRKGIFEKILKSPKFKILSNGLAAASAFAFFSIYNADFENKTVAVNTAEAGDRGHGGNRGGRDYNYNRGGDTFGHVRYEHGGRDRDTIGHVRHEDYNYNRGHNNVGHVIHEDYGYNHGRRGHLSMKDRLKIAAYVGALEGLEEAEEERQQAPVQIIEHVQVQQPVETARTPMSNVELRQLASQKMDLVRKLMAAKNQAVAQPYISRVSAAKDSTELQRVVQENPGLFNAH